ncbi:hypothetical protein HRD49_04925 [Corallococcus exiguus]|uniref:Uncharacterized protein n=1 Tax=Corallococcus exiguus TaxID=83462 RepID=A0A7Y1RUH2_9BACT|nr:MULTISPECIES: hypothetical protein [Corallococcus]NBC45431.1 hypothetical protein [Corallococcus exiguus]NNB90487.1 hypothetical protein [Corallococcus exiguus]NNC03837.1 hypothetical protein [Corallococcus exiguus]NNC17902.1 hypothetical protein [Corallococcus exiguus]NPC50523.1 hypothetical protein [Corallococcus exiguus]
MSGPGPQLESGDPRIKIFQIVRFPAFFLLVVGVLHVTFSLLGGLLAALKVASPFSTPGQAPVVLEFTTGFTLAILGGILCGVLAVWGAWNAMNLKGYGLATVGAICAMYTLTPGCFVGVPVAVWMLFTLRRDGVREAFAP